MNKIVKIDKDELMEILKWDNENFKDKGRYRKTLENLEVSSIECFLGKILTHQSERRSERNFAYALKNKKGKIVAFTFFYIFDVKQTKYNMFIQAIVTHPDYQRKGYAKELLTEIFKNPIKYIGKKPEKVEALININNNISLSFFNSFVKFYGQPYYEDMIFLYADFSEIQKSLNSALIVK